MSAARSPRQSIASTTGDFHQFNAVTTPMRRSNFSNVHTPDNQAPAPSGSPTSTLSGDSASSARLNDSRSNFQRMMSTGTVGAAVNLGTPGRKVVIRSDPSLVSCFDPADKELYDLWVPKQ